MTTTPVASLRHVYHLNPLRLLIFPLMWVAAVGLCLHVSFNSVDAFTPAANGTLLILIGLVTLFVAPFFALIWQSRLVLTPNGITHHQFGYTIRSSWDNVAMLDLTPQVQRLVLSQPGTRSRLLSASVGVLNVAAPGTAEDLVGDVGAYAEGRLITLAPFMTHWKRGPLQDDLRRWAPRLFGEGGRPIGG